MKQQVRRLVLVAGCVLAVGFVSAQGAGGVRQGQPVAGTPQANDIAFMRQLALGGLADVEHARLAVGKASGAGFQQLAQRVVTERGNINAELKALAASKHVTLPTELDAYYRARQDELSLLRGEAFERAYFTSMIINHDAAVGLLQGEIDGGTDADVRAWARKVLPTVQAHLRTARSLFDAKVQ